MKDLFKAVSNERMSVTKSHQLHIIYDSYLEESIKECERIRRRSKCDSLEFMKLNISSPVPIQMDRFWNSGKNNEKLQQLSRDYFVEFRKSNNIKTILKGYVTDENGVQSCIEAKNGNVYLQPDLDSSIEGTDY